MWLYSFITYGLFTNTKSIVTSSRSRMDWMMNPGSFMCTPACLGLFEPGVYYCPFVNIKFYSPYVGPFAEQFQILMKSVLGLSISLSPPTLHGSYPHRRKQQQLQFLFPLRGILILGPAGRHPSVLFCLLFWGSWEGVLLQRPGHFFLPSPPWDSEWLWPLSIWQHMTPVRGSSFSCLALPSLPQEANTATETEWSCPICHDAQDDVAYGTPCHHQFCLGFILWRVKRKPPCPLCWQTQHHDLLCAVRGRYFGDGSSTPLQSISCWPPGWAGGCGAGGPHLCGWLAAWGPGGSFLVLLGEPQAPAVLDEPGAVWCPLVGGGLGAGNHHSPSVQLRAGRGGLGPGAAALPATPDGDICEPSHQRRHRPVQRADPVAPGAPGLPCCPGGAGQPCGHPWTHHLPRAYSSPQPQHTEGIPWGAGAGGGRSLLLAQSGTAYLGGPGAPQKGGPPAPRTLQPARGHATSNTRVPQNQWSQAWASSWGMCWPPRGLGGTC